MAENPLSYVTLSVRILKSQRFRDFKDALAIRSNREAVSYLAMLFLFTGNDRPDGNLGPLKAHHLAEDCEWEGDADEFLQALLKTKWLITLDDGGYRLEGWERHGGKAIEYRRSDRERKKEKAHSDGAPSELPGNSDGVPMGKLGIPPNSVPKVKVKVKDKEEETTENAPPEILESREVLNMQGQVVAAIGSGSARTISYAQLEIIARNEFGWDMQAHDLARKLAPYSRNEIDDARAATLSKSGDPNFLYFIKLLRSHRNAAEKLARGAASVDVPAHDTGRLTKFERQLQRAFEPPSSFRRAAGRGDDD